MATLEELTERIRRAAASGDGLGRTVKLDLKGEGVIHLDGASVTNDDRPADLTVSVSRADLVRLGDLGPSSLYGQFDDYQTLSLDFGVRRYMPLKETRFRVYGEGTIGGPLTEIQKAHPDTIIGSYPKYQDGTFWTELVIRSRDAAALAAGKAAVEAMLAEIAAAKSQAPAR